jgi:hypothetical protein
LCNGEAYAHTKAEHEALYEGVDEHGHSLDDPTDPQVTHADEDF